jgi:hypothetical protein
MSVQPDDFKNDDVTEVKDQVEQVDLSKTFKNIVLLTDEDISSSQKKAMIQHFAVMVFEAKWHARRKVTDIAGADIFIINVGKGLTGRTDGIKFYETNLKLFKKLNYEIIYYRTKEFIRKDNLEKLKYDYRIVELPGITDTAEDYLFLLQSDKMPQVRPWYTRLWQAIVKKN